jgi:hypothetical protein
MNYEASEWEPGNVALVSTPRYPRQVRMLIVLREGPFAGDRLWWKGSGQRSSFCREAEITDIERVTVLTNEHLNHRVEVNP